MKPAIATLTALIPTILLGLLPFSATASAVSTTRLKSTAGAGVGTLLMDEATFLNPASISFFQVSSFYIQKAGSDVNSTNDQPLKGSSEDELVFIASDAKGTIDGSVSYARMKDKDGKSSRLGFSMSSPIGERSALGFSYALTDRDEGVRAGKSKQITGGVTHALAPEFTIGLVAHDILGEEEVERRAIIGAQYVYKDFIALMFDVGTDWERKVEESSLIRGALQLKIFQDFYMRFGAQEDRGLAQKGTGMGLGWVQPRLVLEVALARTEYSELKEIGQVASEAKETSFSLSYRF